MNDDWDSVSNDTLPDSKTDDWDAVSAPGPTIERKQQAHRSQPEPRAARAPVKRKGISASSVAIIVLSLAVIGLSVFSGLNIFHVVNFNIGSAIVAATQQTPDISGASDIPLFVKQVTSGTPVLNDPLTDDRNNWGLSQYSGVGKCTISGGALHLTQAQSHYPLLCYCTGLFQLNNFALQIDMNIVQGSEGGIVFGQGSTTDFTLAINSDGSYSLYAPAGGYSFYGPTDFSSTESTIEQSSSPAIKSGLNQSNQIIIIKKNTDFYFYANNQLVTHEILSAYVNGGADLTAISSGQATDVSFSNLKVWTL